MSKTIEQRATFDIIRYANCWEDADILLQALGDLKSSNVLSIASAGDNALALLASNPQLLVALDISVPQLACLEIKKACFRLLDVEEIYGFLGVKMENDSRTTLYHKKLREVLSRPSKEYWDKNQQSITDGIIFTGKFEHYFQLFRKYVLRLIHSPVTINDMLQLETTEQQNLFYQQRWNSWRWRFLFQLFFNRRVMGSAGRDPEFFKFVEKSVARHIFQRVEIALKNIPAKSNPYLQFILKGNFMEALPFYLRRENVMRIKDNLDALEIFQGNTSSTMKRYNVKWQAYNLSDIFEYMDPAVFKEVAAELLENARQDARFAYWNMLVPRSIAQLFPQRVYYDEPLSQNLFKQDKAFFYQSFHLDRML